MSATGMGGLTVIERKMDSRVYCDVLQETILKIIKELGRHFMSQHDSDPNHTSKMTIKFCIR